MSRSRSTAARRAAVEASGHLQRSEAWSGLRSGDPVVVAGLALRGAEWRFRAHVLNRHNGTESVEVVGGRPYCHPVARYRDAVIWPGRAPGC